MYVIGHVGTNVPNLPLSAPTDIRLLWQYILLLLWQKFIFHSTTLCSMAQIHLPRHIFVFYDNKFVFLETNSPSIAQIRLTRPKLAFCHRYLPHSTYIRLSRQIVSYYGINSRFTVNKFGFHSTKSLPMHIFVFHGTNSPPKAYMRFLRNISASYNIFTFLARLCPQDIINRFDNRKTQLDIGVYFQNLPIMAGNEIFL